MVRPRFALPSVLVAGLCLAAPAPAEAFCGLYVAGADAQLVNDATHVVLMRAGNRTVVSMQNHYEGPPEDFAMVVPVPTVLRKADVRTLPVDVFERIDRLSSPRLVEYWEQDPCPEPSRSISMEEFRGIPIGSSVSRDFSAVVGTSVTVEARFAVGEYEIVILSARDSRGLDTWLRAEGYNIPAGAEEALRSYVAKGMKFFVAKVDVSKVKFEDGRAKLSPLRFHYDSDEFSLPIRLGMLNARGEQDLVVNVLAPQRYEVANYVNVAIPTNLEVTDAVRDAFGSFYASLLTRVLEENPGSVVTEYAWSAQTCDPCPGPTLTADDLATLGADAYGQGLQTNFTLTRLHTRYDADSDGQDLVFRAATAISGGREVRDRDGVLEPGPTFTSFDNFQARYIIRHRWSGPVTCQSPHFGIWGGEPPAGAAATARGTQVARDVAFVEKTAEVSDFIEAGEGAFDRDLIGLGGDFAPYEPPPPTREERREERRQARPAASGGGCQRESTPPMANLGVFLLGLGLAGARRRRRR